jgi:GntR family transcriptional regulator
MPHQSISQRLHKDLGRIIAAAEPGERLPSEPTLSKQLGVSRATLREAMRTFEIQGMIRRKQGSGTYVTHPTTVIESGLEVLESIESLAEHTGLPVTMGTLNVTQRQPNETECQILGISCDNDVISVSRVINAENRPVAYLIDILPLDILKPDELETGFTGSVLDLLLERGTPELEVSRTEINAVQAPVEIARAMDIQRGDVLLRFEALLYTTTGQVVDHSFSYFLPGYFRFHVVRRVG